MSSATNIVTQQNIAEREQKALQLRALLRTLPKGSPKHHQAVKALKALLTEIAALRASLHYYKPTPALTADIAAQRKKVTALTALFKKSKGEKKLRVGKQLRAEAKTLNEMLAAAKGQQVQTGLKVPLPANRRPPLTLVPDSAEATANPLAAEATLVEQETSAEDTEFPSDVDSPEAVPAGFQPSEFSLEAIPEMAETAIAKIEESWDKLDEYTDEEGEVWYKNPIVLVGAGTAIYLILRRSLRS